VYLPDELAAAVRDAQVPVSAICQKALEEAVRTVGSARATDAPAAAAAERQVGMLSRFTARARTALTLAEKRARELSHNYVGTEQGLASQVLRRMGVELRTTRRTVVAALSGFVYARETLTPTTEPPDAMQQILTRLEALEQKLGA